MHANYDDSLRRLLLHEGGYTNHPSDPGGPTKFGITIADYRKYVKPHASATDVRAMTADEARRIYRTKYWDAQRCDELPAGVDYAVFDYGVNSGLGRSGKVLRRLLALADHSSVVNDTVLAAARAADARALIVAICDERLRFLQSLKTWHVFGKGWSRRVAEVKAAALMMAAGAPPPDPALGQTQSRGIVLRKGAPQVVVAAVITAGAAAAGQAHQSGARPLVIGCVAAAVMLTAAGWLFWSWRRRRRQQRPAPALERNAKEILMWDKVKAWFRHSVTILWARAVALGGLLLAVVEQLLQDPNVTAAIQAALQPKFIPYYVIAIGLVTEIARRRTARGVD